MGQEPSKDEAIAGENHEARHSIVRNDHCEDGPVQEISHHSAKKEEVIDIEDVAHTDPIDGENQANLAVMPAPNEDRKTLDQESQNAAIPSGKEECVPSPPNGIQDSSVESIAASHAMDAAQTPGVAIPKKKMTTPNLNDTKIVMGNPEPAKRSSRVRLISGGFVGGLLLGPFGFLLVLWTPIRKRLENVLLVSIGVLLAILVWIVIVAISVGVTVK